MNDKEFDRMIGDVVASFRIDNIMVSPKFILSMKQKFINKNKGKSLIKKEKKDEY